MIENANNDARLNSEGQKLSEADVRSFQAMLNGDGFEPPLTDDEASEAYRNLGEFVMLLVKINQRVGLVNLADPSLPFVHKNNQ